MTTINEITLEDLDNKAFVTNYARSLVFPEFQLERIFPQLNFQGIEWKWNSSSAYQEPAISYRAWDTEVPIGKRPGVERKSQEMLPLGKKKILTEEHRIREEAINSGDWGGFIQTSLQDIENLTQGVHSRWELDRASLLSTGVINLKGPHNGVDYEWQVDIDYGIPGGNKWTASPLWSSTSTADPLLDLTTQVRAYKIVNKGLAPAEILISNTVLGYLLQNAAIRSILYYGAANAAPSVLTEGLVQAEFQARGLPKFTVIDEQVTASDGTYSDVLPQNKIIFLPPANVPLGNTVHGRTAEALGMIQQGVLKGIDGAGIVASSWDSEGDPPQRFNKVAAVGFPIIRDPNLIMIGTVA